MNAALSSFVIVGSIAILSACSTNVLNPSQMHDASLEAALEKLSPNPEECIVPGGHRVKAVNVRDVPEKLIRDGRSGWSIIRFSMKDGKVTSAKIEGSSPGGHYDVFSLQHVKSGANPLASDAEGCLMSVSVKLT